MDYITRHLPSAYSLMLILCASVALYLVYLVIDFLVIRPWFSALCYLPGPKSDSIIWGNLKSVINARPGMQHEAWEAEFGHVYSYSTMLSARRLYTSDTLALSYILNNSTDYQKPDSIRHGLADILGEGLLFVEGETHRRQRRIMNPSFGTPHLRALTPVFFEKAQLLCEKMLHNIANSSPTHGYVTDIQPWLARTTLDIIGQAGFDYQFNSLENDGENELAIATKRIFTDSQRITALKALRFYVPLARLIPDTSESTRTSKQALATVRRIGMQLVKDKKAAVLRASDSLEGVAKGDVVGKDLLSALIRANVSVDLKESQKMSDDEVLSQISTFIVAGHETTSTALTWCLYALSTHPQIQSKLRSEIVAVPTTTLSMDDLNALPYLDAVVRETLRIHCPVPNTFRHPAADGFIPLRKPFVDRWGNMHNQIRVKKGDGVLIPIRVLARSKQIWGEDALDFKPERWQSSLPDAAHDVPSIWSNLPTFISGPRACIGYKFAIIEMKAILFSFLRNIEFELADLDAKISEVTNIVSRPIVESEPDKGSQLPLRLRAVRPRSH